MVVFLGQYSTKDRNILGGEDSEQMPNHSENHKGFTMWANIKKQNGFCQERSVLGAF